MNKYFSIFAAVLFLVSISVGKSYASDFTDTFTDTDGTSLQTHNSLWTSYVNKNCTIVNNQATDVSGSDCNYYFNQTGTDGMLREDVVYHANSQVGIFQRGSTSVSNLSDYDLLLFRMGTSGSGELILISNGGPEQDFNFANGTFTDGQIVTIELDDIGTDLTAKLDGITHLTGTTPERSGFFGMYLTNGEAVDNYTYTDVSSSPTPPTSGVKIAANPASSNVSVGMPFNVDVTVGDGSQAFNAAQATVTVSSNLSITGIHNATSNACNFQYSKQPIPSDPSFAGAIFGGSSTSCTAYTMTLTPTSPGTGTVTFTNGAVKAYSDSSEILSGVQNGSFTIGASPTSTPTSGIPQLTITSPLETYYIDNNYTLAGGKDTSITHVFVNNSETGVTFPTSTTWQVSETLAALGTNNTQSDNFFTISGSDGTNSTATQTVDVSRHTLGDINGDGVVDLTDASLFAVDFGKTSGLTYVLSDMNGDGSADLTDLSILAKLED